MPSTDDRGPAEPPWSPFPVQDWSRLPADPLTASGVDPSWAPPEHRRWWTPLVVFAVIAGLIGAAAWAGTSLGVGPRASAATRFVPPDGAAAYARVDVTRETTTTAGYTVTESARLANAAALLSGDPTFTTRALADVYDDPDLQLWRTTTTEVAAAAPVDQTTRFYQVDDAVRLLGQSAPTEGYVYSPGLVELPADVAAGRSWTSSGSAGATLDYRSELAATAAADGCLVVTGILTYRQKTGTSSWNLAVERQWCPGRGLVVAKESLAPSSTTVTQVDALPDSTARAAEPSTVDTPVRWADPTAWREHNLTTTSINPLFGEGTMNGAAHGSVIPVRTTSGLVVRPLASPTDLLATTPKTLTSWTTVWRIHPGGQILTLAVFGNVIVVTTSERRVVGYADTGVRLWSRQLDDLAPTPAIRLDDSTGALADLAGQVQSFDLATGEVRWRHGLGADVGVTPVAGGGVVVVMDRGQTTTGLDAADGRVRWTADLDGRAAVVAGGVAVVVQDQTAHALALDSGRTRWLQPYLGVFSEVDALGDRTVLASRDATVMVDGAGRELGRWAGARHLTRTADHLVSWGDTEALVVDVAATVVHAFPIPPVTTGFELRPGVATPEGIQLYAADWTFRSWTGD